MKNFLPGILPFGAPPLAASLSPEASGDQFPEMPAGLKRQPQATNGADTVDPNAQNKIAQPKPDSKEAQVRALREGKADETKPSAPAPAAPKAPDNPKPEKPKESDVRTTTKKKAPAKPKASKTAQRAASARKADAAKKKATGNARKPVEGDNKGETLIKKLQAGWTTMETIQKDTGWQPHTARAFFSRLRKPVKDGGRGLKVEQDREKGYRIV